MAILTRRPFDRNHKRVYLYAEHTVGRSPSCKLVLVYKSVSSFHACVSWHGDAWTIRDLGSRNGTYVNGQRVKQPTTRALRRNDEIAFGDRQETWVLVDDSPPQAMLIPIDAADGALILDELRAFPSDESPHTTIFQDRDRRFFLEREDGAPQQLEAQQQVSIGDVTYRVHLPGAVDGVLTTRTSAESVADSGVRAMQLTLKVAPDEETAAAIIDAGDVQAELHPRVHLYLLVHLARLRVKESRASSAHGDPDADTTGWVAVQVLCDDLQLTREQLALQVFRIRDDMKKIGLPNAAEIIDRRRRGWIRIGVAASQIRLGRM